MTDRLTICRESPDQPEIALLLDALDRYLMSLYDPKDNHILDLQALLAPEVCFLVARDDGTAVATGAFRRMPAEADGGGDDYGEIKRMYVDPAQRGRGIGERMLSKLEDGLRAEGIGMALLETGRDQHAAVRLYERCGYRARPPFGGYPDNGLSSFYGKAL